MLIGADALIRHGVTIIPGVSISMGAIVCSGAAVTYTVMPGKVVGDDPAVKHS
ncbi:MAG: hypothetical protein GY951_12590 [Psychromonas sp.]|nr:hypothetical protein [Psychromonas sp.]